MDPLFLEEAFNSLQTGIALLQAIRVEGVIEDFRWIYANNAALQISNSKLEELKETTLLRKLPSSKKFFNRLVEVVESASMYDEVVFHAENGKWLKIRVKKFHDGYITTLVDITKEKQAEERVRESEILFKWRKRSWNWDGYM